MKKILAIVLICAVIVGLTGCAGDTHISVNAENADRLSGGKFGKSALVEIGDGLYYDSTTRIVYWWNCRWNATNAIAPSPYYAPNGLPYRYNPETNTFEEI
jgi:hypothetical protein